MSGEKTEKPTQKKKDNARKEGTVARTPDFGIWASMLACGLILPMTLSNVTGTVRELMSQMDDVIADPDTGAAMRLLGFGLREGAIALAPLAAITIVIAIGAAAAQGGIKPATKLLKPKFHNFDPVKGIKKLFGPQSMWEGAKSLLKTLVLGGVAYWSMRDLIPLLLVPGTMPLSSLVGICGDAVFSLIRGMGLAGLGLAAADYAMSRRRTNKQLRMSKQEIKEEHKQMEGDPHVKGHIRAKQQAMGRSRMMADVPEADVVLVNPTHVAVALRYDPDLGAPRVVAKGAGAVAAKIREMADEHRIPMVQDIPLARALYKACEPGQEIPPAMYGAIAKVLAFVMNLKSRGTAAGFHRLPA